jgi:parallel beta-helix repeat protein
MKVALLLAMLVFTIQASATNYYVSASGNDNNNGTSTSSPWKTLNKVNSAFSSFKAGDNIYLNRGDIFYGSIIVTKSGSSGAPITISAYGSGNKPVITGFTTVSSWTNLGNNIWESSSAVSTLSSCNIVVINGVNTAMGRYPNTGYLTYESCSGNTSITSSSVNSGSTNWTGAEAVIRKNDWIIDRCKITNHSGSTLNYSDPYTNDLAIANYGFFIQNDSRTLDQQNEWYFNPSTKKIRIYSASSPTNVQVATVANLLSSNGYGYITVDGITFTGSSEHAIYFYQSTVNNCIVQNSDLSFCGQNAIYIVAGNACSINNNTILNCNRAGIQSDGGTGNSFTGNIITNVGVVRGQAYDGGRSIGISVSSQNAAIKYNTIKNVSYAGIYISYSMGTGIVQNNFIDGTCVVLDDAGGIYTTGVDAGVRTIDHNIIINTIGNREGTNNTTRVLSGGIYLDELSSNVTVTNNTVANGLSAGIKMHKASNNTVNNNTSFNNSLWQIYFQNATSSPAIYGNTLNNNIFFSKASSQLTLGFVSVTNDIMNFGTADNNYYARPIDDNNSVNTYQPNTNYVNRTLSSWQSFTGQDIHSHKSPKAITNINDVRFEYNATSSNKTVSLDGNYIDVKNVSYNGSITLSPYTSAVLIRNGAANQPPTANAGSNQTITLPTNAVTLSGSGTDPDGSISSYNWTQLSGPSSGIITNSSSAATTVTGLLAGVYLFQLKVTDNGGAINTNDVQVTVNAAVNSLPTANAGGDQSITLPTNNATLSGSGTVSGGSISSYNWTKISGPASGIIANANSASTSVTGLVEGTYQFQLKVTDNKGGTAVDNKLLIVNADATGGLLPAVNPANTGNGIDYKYYQRGFGFIPDFSSLTPQLTGTSTSFDISPATRATSFAFNFTGFIYVPSDGQYTFYTNSDDGSNLYIDNVLVVNNDGLHAAIEKSGTIGLKAGKHAISVGYIQAGVDKSLDVRYAGPGISKQIIPSSALYRILPAQRKGLTQLVKGDPVADKTSVNQSTVPSVITQFSFKAYPNPFVNSILINITGEAGDYQLVLVDAIGRTLWIKAGTKNAGTFQESINTSSIQKGIYFLKLIQNNNSTVLKLEK